MKYTGKLSNSEANASEILRNLEYIFLVTDSRCGSWTNDCMKFVIKIKSVKGYSDITIYEIILLAWCQILTL